MIYVCDSIMGSGKTSAAITYMNEHPEKKFIYVTPYLTECDRIKEACPDISFTSPSGKCPGSNFSKITHIAHLLAGGRNVVTTHQALRMLPKSSSDMIREQGYTMILDECLQVMVNCDISPCDIKLLEIGGYVERLPDGQYRRTDAEYDNGMFSDLLRSFDAANLFDVGKTGVYFWFIDPCVFSSFEDVIIMTYMLRGQPLCYYLQANNFSWKDISVQKRDGVFRFCDSKEGDSVDYGAIMRHIRVIESSRVNGIGDDYYALSMSWYQNNPEKVKKLKGHLRGFFEREMKGTPAKNWLWATYSTSVNKLKGRGYTNHHLAFNARAMNDYSHCTALAYPVNLFMNASECAFFRGRGYPVDNDAYALSTMLQWIWRSAIRNGEDVTLYLPSRRMRELLYQWMESVNGGVYFDEETEAS